MIFKSNWTKNQVSDKELFDYIGDMNNMPSILPEQVVDVKADHDNLSFTIQGMGSIALRVAKREPNKLIQLVPEGKTPFQFVLNIYIRDTESPSHQVTKSMSVSECCFEIDAQLNPLMQMMASRPLQNLVNMMASRAEELKS
ncbi:MAG: hypothetical protein E7067_04975 [Lentimicrobiaceae bacterium]|nr:hypothetical protein [Lentimicrobiaceae bacterium]